MRKIAVGILLICAVCLTAFGEDGDDRIYYLFELSGAGELGVMMFDSVMQSFKGSFPDVPAEFWNRFSEEVDGEKLIALLIPIYRKYYTPEDIEGLISFYETPLGKKMIAAQPAIVQESMEAGELWGQELAIRVLALMKEEGYNIQ